MKIFIIINMVRLHFYQTKDLPALDFQLDEIQSYYSVPSR